VTELTKGHRQAMSMAVDRALITEQIFEGARDPANSVIPPNLQGRADVCPSWNYDPVAAKALWDTLPPLGPITVWFNSGFGHELWVEAVVNLWGQNLGLDTSTVSFESLEFSEYLPFIDNRELTGPFRLGWGMDYPSALNFLEPLFASYNAAPVGSNNAVYNNPDFDALLASGKQKLAATGNMADALPDFFAAEEILCDDVGVMPMFFSKNQYVWSEDVDNVVVDAYGDLGYTVITAADGSVTTYITEPEHLFPTTSNESEGVAVLRAVFKGLVDLDASGEVFFANAESITSDDGGQTWTVTLNSGWTFHNGEPVTAASYVNAWNYGAYGPNAQQNNSFYSNIVGYDEINPETEG
jgi:ABC-type oligopeptide transport system substrate-binding subunit